MTPSERRLIHQIHPLKLFVDFFTSFWSVWFLWQGAWAQAAAVAFLPSIAVTLVLLWRADLAPLRDSPLGRYVVATMDGSGVAIRSFGQVIAWFGAAMHLPWLIPLGYAVIVFGWMRGLWRQSPERSAAP